MAGISVPSTHAGDSESRARDFGLVSCYEARLNATMIVRAMDRERARQPITVKLGRLARTETAADVSRRSAVKFVHVVTGSAMHADPV